MPSCSDTDLHPQVASGMILVMAFFLITYTFHSTWVTSEAYSSPSIVLSARGGDGSRIIFDDFREAYYWLRHNTPEVTALRPRRVLAPICMLTARVVFGCRTPR